MSASAPKLVTGANGFLGAAVVRALLRAREPVRALVRAGSDRRNLEGLDVEVAIGDAVEVLFEERGEGRKLPQFRRTRR